MNRIHTRFPSNFIFLVQIDSLKVLKLDLAVQSEAQTVLRQPCYVFVKSQCLNINFIFYHTYKLLKCKLTARNLISQWSKFENLFITITLLDLFLVTSLSKNLQTIDLELGRKATSTSKR